MLISKNLGIKSVFVKWNGSAGGLGNYCSEVQK